MSKTVRELCSDSSSSPGEIHPHCYHGNRWVTVFRPRPRWPFTSSLWLTPKMPTFCFRKNLSSFSSCCVHMPPQSMGVLNILPSISITAPCTVFFPLIQTHPWFLLSLHKYIWFMFRVRSLQNYLSNKAHTTDARNGLNSLGFCKTALIFKFSFGHHMSASSPSLCGEAEVFRFTLLSTFWLGLHLPWKLKV